MSRPLRIEYPGALYHLTARGNSGDDIYLNDEDRYRFLQLFGQEIEQQGWICYAYCLMDNHYHLLVETPEGNLVCGMRRPDCIAALAGFEVVDGTFRRC